MPIKSAPPSLRVTSGDDLRSLLTGASFGIKEPTRCNGEKDAIASLPTKKESLLS
jgi:hypothetical protein